MSRALDGKVVIMSRMVKVWDPFVRIFHWSLVTAFTVAWITAEEWDRVHEWSGYVAAGLVILRILWGLVGSRYARFSQFVRPPRAVMAYLADMTKLREKRYLGHNPAGAAMIVVLLLAMIVLAATGWMAMQPASAGMKWAKEVHEVIANATLLLVGVHVAGVILASIRHGENLVRSMVSGLKREAD